MSDMDVCDQCLQLPKARAEIGRLRAALEDFATLLPPDRWRLLRPATKETLRTASAKPTEGT